MKASDWPGGVTQKNTIKKNRGSNRWKDAEETVGRLAAIDSFCLMVEAMDAV
jgi:hypothetical protein